ncbi:hypothetical protein HPB52_009537 [Rhipicephalus sanguineus]|uniref:BTB domain-containing protein n=1 Tax=Rhipicephalus sanguineus TaxID=34632 RepID=A0A9D4PD43_RHISA|nr:hypothetical protein HPB52_009537 [Rhipicephalus sanguineus]
MLQLKNQVIDAEKHTLDMTAILGLDLQKALDNVTHEATQVRDIAGGTVSVRVGGRTFEVDLELLKKHSCYFAKCFHKLPQEALKIPLELQDVKPEVFEALVLFMETGFLDADPFMALDIYEASMLLGIHRAIKEIKRISLIGSKMERLLVWYRTANKGSSGRDRQAALRLVASRFDEVVADERFLRLSVAEVVPLFSCSRLGTSGEVPVFLAALRWLNHDYCKRQQYVVQLLKCVRFSLMSREEIVHCFHPPLLSNITRFPSVAFMVLAAFGVVSLQEEGREHLLSRFASQPRTFLCPKPDDQHQTSLWPLPGPPEGSVAQRRHRAATALQTAWRVRKARRDLALKRRQAKGVSMTDTDVGTADSYAPRTHLRESSLKNVNDTSGVEASKEAQSVKSNGKRYRQHEAKIPAMRTQLTIVLASESVTSDSSTRTMPSPVKEPFTPILKVVIKEERSVRDKSGMATDDSLLRSQASLLKLVPPPKKEDKGECTGTTASRMRGPLAATLRNDLCGAVADARCLSSRRGIGGGVGMRARQQHSYFRFPSVKRDRQRREAWIRAVRRQNEDGSPWQPSDLARLCEKHFVKGSPSNSLRHPDFVPSLLVYTDGFKKNDAFQRYSRTAARTRKGTKPPKQRPGSSYD